MLTKLLSPLFAVVVLFTGAFQPLPLSAAPAEAQKSTVGVNGSLSVEQLESARKAAEADTLLDDAQRKKALELYDQALKWLQEASEARNRLTTLQTQLKTAPKRIEALRGGAAGVLAGEAELQSALTEGELRRIEPMLAQEDILLQQARDTHRTQADELAALLVGTKGLTEEIAAKLRILEKIGDDLRAAPGDEPPAISTARVAVLQARRLLRQSELDWLKLRLGNLDLLTQLAQAERDAAAAEVAGHQRRLATLTEAAQRLRGDQARQARLEAEALASQIDSLPPALQRIALDYAGFRRELEEVVGREQVIAEELQGVRRGLAEIKEDFERARQRVEVVGATEAVGKMLQRRRQELPSIQKYRRNSAKRGQEIGRAADRQLEIDELLRPGRDNAADVLAGLRESAQEGLVDKARELIAARREALNELQKVYGRYIGRITAVDLAERQLVETAEAYVQYIDDQLVWIPGGSLLTLLAPSSLAAGLSYFLDPGLWRQLAGDLIDLAGQRTLRLAAVLLLFLLLLRKRAWAEARLEEMAPLVRKIRSDGFALTLKALMFSLLTVAAWPLLMIGSGGLLGSLPTVSPTGLSLATGLIKAGAALFSVQLMIRICLPQGLGEGHLRWPTPVCETLVKELTWLARLAVPLSFVVAAGSGQEAALPLQALGQIAFIALMLISAVFLYRLFPGSGTLMSHARSGPLAQLHFLWFPLMVLLPLSFATTSALGYQQAALHLQRHSELTFWLFLGLFLVKELLLRWLFIADRRLRFEDALRRRDELRAQRAQSPEEKEDEASPIFLDVPEIDFDELSEQNKRLLRAGFLFGAVAGIWSIWSDLLPAMGFLYSTELPLHAARIVDGVAQEVPITLGDLTIGIIMVVITVLAAKNIPGVLEIALLQRLPLDPGARYAITALTQYVIAGIGVVLAFSTLGLQWSSIQWLVAALSVGLGFGLQEIVANFISGIILLFERPIRVGDVVTLDNTTGVVSRIRIRATTITNYDKQELLIPNKEFITGRVINWTLSDKTNRVVITVGVAYGSDVSRAMALMLEAAKENQEVLEEPKPVVSFESFGDNALTLLLRSYLGGMENRLATITALHQAINDKFNAAGINIAFPQRDIHLSVDKPLDVRLHRAEGG